jgi:hypothetical protein
MKKIESKSNDEIILTLIIFLFGITITCLFISTVAIKGVNSLNSDEVHRTLAVRFVSGLNIDAKDTLYDMPLNNGDLVLSINPEKYGIFRYSDNRFVPANDITTVSGSHIVGVEGPYAFLEFVVSLSQSEGSIPLQKEKRDLSSRIISYNPSFNEKYNNDNWISTMTEELSINNSTVRSVTSTQQSITNFIGSTDLEPGIRGLVPSPDADEEVAFLSNRGTWEKISDGVTSVAGKQGDVVLNLSDITDLVDTDDLPAGTTNFYYTDLKVTNNSSVALNTAKISADGLLETHSNVDFPSTLQDKDILAYDSVSGQFINQDLADLGLPSSTDDLVEGSTNLYYTDSRVTNNSSVALNTDKISADGLLDTHSNVDFPSTLQDKDILAYDSGSGQFINQDLADLGLPSSTDDLVEGSTNLYYTDSRVTNNSSVALNTDKISADGLLDTHSNVDFPSTLQDKDILAYDSGSGQFINQDLADLGLPSSTDDLVEGSTNLYYTDSRVTANSSVALNTAKISADGLLDTHSNVDFPSTLQDKDILAYDSGSGQFINQDLADLDIFSSSGGTITGDIDITGTINTLTPAGGKYSQWDEITVTGTSTTETSLVSSSNNVGTIVLQTSELSLGSSYHIKVAGTFTSSSKETAVYKFKLGGVEILGSVVSFEYEDLKGFESAYELEIDFHVRSVGTSGLVYSNAQFLYIKDAPGSLRGNSTQQTQVIDLSPSSMAMDITWAWSTANDISITNKMIVVTRTY